MDCCGYTISISIGDSSSPSECDDCFDLLPQCSSVKLARWTNAFVLMGDAATMFDAANSRAARTGVGCMMAKGRSRQ